MEQVIFRPRIYKFDTFKEYAQEKKISDSDLFIVAGEFIYDLYLAPAGVSREMVVSQEKYGIGVLDLWSSDEFNGIPDVRLVCLEKVLH